jgi:hypothetical protein
MGAIGVRACDRAHGALLRNADAPTYAASYSTW